LGPIEPLWLLRRRKIVHIDHTGVRIPFKLSNARSQQCAMGKDDEVEKYSISRAARAKRSSDFLVEGFE
jgi:hypothetical protein